MVVIYEKPQGDLGVEKVDAAPEPSQIQEYYKGSTAFVTGATGFLGKLIVEKLLRSCAEIKKLYILVREKKGKTPEKRLEEMLDVPLFEKLKRDDPKALMKIAIVTGDCALPDLGLTDEDKQKLINEVNCVFHCAATVRFDEKIRAASYINVRATRDLLKLGKQMKQLKGFVYISTAFSHCVRTEIKEEFYEPTISGAKLLAVLECLDDDVLEQITPILLSKWPNTYAFTKAVAEEVVKSEGRGLPVAVVRPSIVISTVKEPVAGWIDNLYGATGVIVGAALGLIRTVHVKKDQLADMVPADYVINCSIAAAWEAGTAFKRITPGDENGKEEKEAEEVTIYNYVCSPQRPIIWRDFMEKAEIQLKKAPSPLQVWHYFIFLNSSYIAHRICVLFLHMIPAYLVDFLARCIGKKPMLVKGYQKINKFLDVLTYFTTKEWQFENYNTQALFKKLNRTDQNDFDFDMGNFNWYNYLYNYAIGGRVYLLKDPLDTLPQGRAKYLKLQIAHYVVVSLLFLGMLKLFMVLWSVLF